MILKLPERLKKPALAGKYWGKDGALFLAETLYRVEDPKSLLAKMELYQLALDQARAELAELGGWRWLQIGRVARLIPRLPRGIKRGWRIVKCQSAISNLLSRLDYALPGGTAIKVDYLNAEQLEVLASVVADRRFGQDSASAFINGGLKKFKSSEPSGLRALLRARQAVFLAASGVPSSTPDLFERSFAELDQADGLLEELVSGKLEERAEKREILSSQRIIVTSLYCRWQDQRGEHLVAWQYRRQAYEMAKKIGWEDMMFRLEKEFRCCKG